MKRLLFLCLLTLCLFTLNAQKEQEEAPIDVEKVFEAIKIQEQAAVDNRPVPEMTPEDKKIARARYALKTSENWTWLGGKVVYDKIQNIRKIQLATQFKGPLQLVLSVYRPAQGNRGNATLLLRFKDWKDNNAEKGVDDKYHLLVWGRFDNHQEFKLDCLENGARTVFLFGYNKTFQVFQKNNNDYATYLDMLINSKELRLQFVTNPLSNVPNKKNTVFFDLRGTREAVDAALAILQADEDVQQIAQRYNQRMINDKKRLGVI